MAHSWFVRSLTVAARIRPFKPVKSVTHPEGAVNFPAALAQAMEFEKGETVEWVVKDRCALTLQRKQAGGKQPR